VSHCIDPVLERASEGGLGGRRLEDIEITETLRRLSVR
jgi:hypothetical protein